MRILLGIKALAAGPGGGAERILVTVASSLANRGHEVSVLTFDRPGTQDFYRLGATVDRVRLGIGDITAQSGPLATAARLKRVRAEVSKLAPQVVVGFMHSSFAILGWALARTGIPVIGSERTSYQHYQRNRFDWMMLMLARPFLARMTSNSYGVCKDFPGIIRKQMVVIPNPVGKAQHIADPVGSTGRILLCVGGLRPEKGHEILLRAFGKVSHRHPSWRLRIVGEGGLRRKLMQLAGELQIEQQVQFAGAIAPIEPEYQRAQLFALPSLYEGFPNCLAEALAHGLPSIGFADCAGTNELIETGTNGLLVGTRDRVSGMAAALDQLMRTPEARRAMGAAAVRSVAGYTLDRITDQWEELLHSVVASREEQPWLGAMA